MITLEQRNIRTWNMGTKKNKNIETKQFVKQDNSNKGAYRIINKEIQEHRNLYR